MVLMIGQGLQLVDLIYSEQLSSIRHRTVHYPELVNSIDRSVDPCNDFYSFVCNGWIKANPIPEQLYLYNPTEVLKGEITKRMKDILDTNVRNPSRETELMSIFYEKCIYNSIDSSADGISRMFKKMRKLRTITTITDWLLEMRSEKLFYEITVSPDEYNSTANVIQIVPTASLLTSQIYFNPAYSDEFIATRALLFKMLELLSNQDVQSEFFTDDVIDQTRRVESFLRVDQTFAKILEETEFIEDRITMTLNELQQTLSSIDWVRYITNFMPSRRLRYSVSRQLFRIIQFRTIQRLEELKFNIDDQTMSDYLDWKVIFHYGNFLGEKFQLIFDEFESKVYGVKRKDVTDDCVKLTTNTFSDIAGRSYLEQYFDFDSVFSVKELIENVRGAFLELLDENYWMDEATKKRARQKVRLYVVKDN
ncbi:peptidase family M13 [Dictyocaulus viviparus]|uniref:Peptidase family M13 n=1 Tax=Dictyocaulus viviparus TaxID=29172 RepID=A0A0D8X817_DICVI|nr:peptidase family M13 [Dictyocaulus viviparus]